jgi:hypothetical protein
MQGNGSFLVNLLETTSMTIYSGHAIFAVMFTYLNGTQEVFGNRKSNFITQINTVSLVNRYISAFHLNAASWIDSFQFELTNTLTRQVTVTSRWGGQGGNPHSISAPILAPDSFYFEINQFSGIFDEVCMRQWKINYYFILCQ